MSLRLIGQSIWANPGNRGKRLRRSFGAVVWQIQKHILGRDRLLTLPNGVNFRARADCVISSALIYAEWPEYRELMFIRSMLRAGDVIIDVGANVGHFALLLADITGPKNIYAFEPGPAAFGRLVENWRLNEWRDDHLYNIAVGSRQGTVYVESCDHPTTTLSVSTTAQNEDDLAVPQVPLDMYRSSWRDKRIGLLKIDVEGHEIEVFRGCRTMLQYDRPRLIMFESLGGSIAAEIREVLESLSYKIFQLGRGGFPDPNGVANQNMFAAPSDVFHEATGNIHGRPPSTYGTEIGQ